MIGDPTLFDRNPPHYEPYEPYEPPFPLDYPKTLFQA